MGTNYEEIFKREQKQNRLCIKNSLINKDLTKSDLWIVLNNNILKQKD